jgi:hypothetical protein
MLPRVEPDPQQPVSSTATVDRVATIATLSGRDNQRSLQLEHPYQIVLLKFVPPGFDTPVIAVDKLDAGSVPNLVQGETVNIVYERAHPRIARLQQGTRLFPGHALTTIILCCVVFAVLLAFIWAIGAFLRLLRRTARL